MKYIVALVCLGMSLGLIGAAKTAIKIPPRAVLTGSKGEAFVFGMSAIRHLYSATHGVFFSRDTSVLPELVVLKSLKSRPVPYSIQLSPQGSFWCAPLIDSNNHCVWLDRVDTDDGKKHCSAGLRSLPLPVQCHPDNHIFWTSNESFLGVFNSCTSSVTLYPTNEPYIPDFNLLEDKYPCFLHIGFEGEVHSVAYDPTYSTVAGLCTVCTCKAGFPCVFPKSYAEHSSSQVRIVTLPAGKKRYAFKPEQAQEATKVYAVETGSTPSLQYSNDGNHLLYTFTRLDGSGQREGILFTKEERGWSSFRLSCADQIRFAKNSQYIFLYTNNPKEPGASVLAEFNCRTRLLNSAPLSDIYAGVLYSGGLIGINKCGALKQYTLSGVKTDATIAQDESKKTADSEKKE